ncbi:MAG: hypothetical protein SGPRY_001933 [Prymnesium sp.]
MRGLRLVIRLGCVAEGRASALVSSANDSLCGNQQPRYWRFENFNNVDATIRAHAGPELASDCASLPVVSSSSVAASSSSLSTPSLIEGEVRRDLIRWTRAVKRGPSAPVRCPTGTAVRTDAYRLEADHVIHAVAPDIEPTWGRYTGPQGEVSDDSLRQPEELLRSAYSAAFEAADAAGAQSVACPALGCGVKGWKPSVSAAFALEAVARLARRGGGEAAVGEVSFVLGSYDIWEEWRRVALALLPQRSFEVGDAAQPRTIEWEIHGEEFNAASTRADGGPALNDVLKLQELSELRLPRITWATANSGLQQGGGRWRWQPHETLSSGYGYAS